MVSLPSQASAADPAAISSHAGVADAQLRHGFGPRVRRLHARIGKAHHQAEGMAFSRALLEGRARPQQVVALIRALAPAYALIEQEAPALASALGADALPWDALGRSAALVHDLALLAALPATPPSAAAAIWLEQLQELARRAPHRLMAHVYVRYGGDLSGGQQLAQQANGILRGQGLPPLSFWEFPAATATLKQALHDGIEAMDLSPAEEEDLLEEAERAFHTTQRLLAELETIA